ncbi:hypothetical protein Leryth_020425 [Lithospermum erythrorhizon]|uniref:Probable purine permease n=1 Tax=Lithospermum erythrorhizon TaxID=34254 RepID=A0AAV3RZU8_LITER|nr:hypothetical protein Leryth_020425 [Lithospermum erythrorhizon]
MERNKMETNNKSNNALKKFFLFLSSFLLIAGCCAGGLITRLYFIHGGKRIWLSSWLQTIGCPIIFVPLSLSYMNRRKTQGSKNTKLVLIKSYLFVCASLIGVVFGAIDYLYGYGSSRLPVSTASLIYGCQLAFTSVFAFILVKQKFTSYSVNTVVLLTLGAVVLTFNVSTDRPKGESEKEYIKGFMMMGLAAVVNGLVIPLMELAYVKANQTVTFTLVMEFDLVMCLFATCLSTIGMLVNNDFEAIGREAREYELGQVIYYTVLASDAIVWQCCLLGLNGVIFCASSLFSGILIAITIPISEVLAVIFFHENFQAQKGISLALSIWGFVSYFYGEITNRNKLINQPLQVETAQVGKFDKSLEKEQTLPIHH